MPAFERSEERRSGVDRRRPDPVQSRLSIIAISGAFAKFWPDFADDLKCGIDLYTRDADPVPRGLDTMAVVVGAGGAEAEALQWLGARALPRDIPVFVVGTDPGRRIAQRLMALGARDYFVLPEDLELFRNTLAAASRAHVTRPAAVSAATDPFSAIVGESPTLKKELARAALLMQHRHARALI